MVAETALDRVIFQHVYRPPVGRRVSSTAHQIVLARTRAADDTGLPSVDLLSQAGTAVTLMAGAAKGRLATAYAAVEDTTALGAGLGELGALSCAGPWHGRMSSTCLAVTHFVVIRGQ